MGDEKAQHALVHVRSYSGQTYAERPESFTWQGRERRVEEVEREWREPGKRCFRMRTSENERFELCYMEAEDRWLLKRLT